MTPDIEYGNLMQKLNTAQREAVSTTEGFVRVIAGAGSGKTRALSCRFAFLVNELGILPGNILNTGSVLPFCFSGKRAGHPAGQYFVCNLYQ